MKAEAVKDLYNIDLKTSDEPYEHRRWFSSKRARVAYDATRYAVKKYALPILKDRSEVFELGAGPATWTKVLLEKAPNARYELVDISSEMLKQAKTALREQKNITYVESDICEFKPQKKYDFFFSSRIIEYVSDKDAAVSTISISLKKGAKGMIITKTPQYRRFLIKKPKSDFHSLQIEPKDLSNLLIKHGCSVLQVTPVTFVFPKLKSAFLDRLLFNVGKFMPMYLAKPFTESYAIIFVKNDY